MKLILKKYQQRNEKKILFQLIVFYEKYSKILFFLFFIFFVNKEHLTYLFYDKYIFK
jgi:hypothetical protein